ncbi:MAG TPA: hypothetical protein VK856_11535, partial [Anaerolineaceae bacterium]|nr:hypothetical protein [Anaerolineaceae bacterium]
LPINEQKNAYKDLYRVLRSGKNAVIVNGWTESKLMNRWAWLMKFMERAGNFVLLLKGKRKNQQNKNSGSQNNEIKKEKLSKPQTGTFVEKLNALWLRKELSEMKLDIFVWRSVSVRFLRAVFHQVLSGKLWLRVLYSLEEKYPRYFGENGQYPLIVIRK